MRWFIIFTLIALLLAGCGPEAPVARTPQTNAPTGQAIAPTAAAYPNPESNSGAYPQPQGSSSYPAPSGPQGPKFSINEPVKVSDTQVTGSGPAGVPIKLISISNAGETIAETTIDASGKFTFDVGGKLIQRDRIALKIGELAGTGLDPNTFLSGPGYDDIPNIGILLASTVVE
jgi:hypothetical protein